LIELAMMHLGEMPTECDSPGEGQGGQLLSLCTLQNGQYAGPPISKYSLSFYQWKD